MTNAPGRGTQGGWRCSLCISGAIGMAAFERLGGMWKGKRGVWAWRLSLALVLWMRVAFETPRGYL